MTMKKNRNLLKLFFTCIQILVLSLPILSLGGYALADKLHFINLAKSVSGSTSADINDNQDIFDEETTDINKYALASINDYGYLNKGQEIETFEYLPKYPTNEVNEYSDYVEGNYYHFHYSDVDSGIFEDFVDIYFDSETDSSNLWFSLHNFSDFSISRNITPSIDDSYFADTIYTKNNGVSIIFFNTFFLLDSSNMFIVDYLYEYEDLTMTLDFIFEFGLLISEYDNYEGNENYRDFEIAFYTFLIPYLSPVVSTDFLRQSTTSELIDIPSFISATEGLSYEEIVSNNYVNTHLLLNLDIVGLFTTGLNGSDYIFLFLNYYLNYVLTFALVFICFDVIMYFILIVRKILDRSVEFTDRREF